MLCSVQVHLPQGGSLSYARGVGGGVHGVEEGFLVGTHGNLILPIEPMVAQLGNPFVKQLL